MTPLPSTLARPLAECLADETLPEALRDGMRHYAAGKGEKLLYFTDTRPQVWWMPRADRADHPFYEDYLRGGSPDVAATGALGAYPGHVYAAVKLPGARRNFEEVHFGVRLGTPQQADILPALWEDYAAGRSTARASYAASSGGQPDTALLLVGLNARQSAVYAQDIDRARKGGGVPPWANHLGGDHRETANCTQVSWGLLKEAGVRGLPEVASSVEWQGWVRQWAADRPLAKVTIDLAEHHAEIRRARAEGRGLSSTVVEVAVGAVELASGHPALAIDLGELAACVKRLYREEQIALAAPYRAGTVCALLREHGLQLEGGSLQPVPIDPLRIVQGGESARLAARPPGREGR